MNSDAQTPHRVVPPKRRRDKPILSCTLCRRRKLKCDRAQPCNSCVHRGLPCTYTAHQPTTRERKVPESVHDRIDQLERLVTSLMDEKTRDQDSPFPDTRPSSQQSLNDTDVEGDLNVTSDRVKLNDDATSYTNSGHWSSILDGITELRDELDLIVAAEQPSTPIEAEAPGPDLLFGRQRHATQHEILAAVPPRHVADQLLKTYFNCMDMSQCIVHQPTFMRKYEQFWNAPFDTPIAWLAIMFSMFATASRFQAVLDNPQLEYPAGFSQLPDNSLHAVRMNQYREKAAQCLILANYAKCPPYTVEALLQYFLPEYFRSQDTQFGIWILIGIIVRVAFRMGYHRDPSRFPNISPFDGEMRRRVWVMILQLDLVFSSQLGLPGMIEPSLYDVAEPRNLIDEDLCEDMIELPPPRPDTEHTIMMYTLVRNRMLQVFRRITDLANSPSTPSYRDVLTMDKDLRAVFDSFPPSMKAIRVRDFDYADSKSTRRRLFLGLSFLKAMLMLHRPFLLLGRTDARYEYSRSVCLNSALEILEYQKKLHREAQPGGRLWTLNWKIWATSWKASSVVNHDFLLATTVLALDLDRDLVSPLPASQEMSNTSESIAPGPTRAEIVEALASAYAIWIFESEKSREARKVAAAVRHVLRKANMIVDDDISRYDAETPMSQFDFASFTQEATRPSAVPETDPMFYGFENAPYMRPFLTDELFRDIPYSNWTDMTFPTMDNTPQNTYLP